MELKDSGWKQELSQAKPIFGYTDTETVKLDFDDTTFKKVKYWAERAMNWFKLGGYIILKSSKNCYHVVFDRSVSWTENMSIVAWVALQCKNRGLVKWTLMQAIKQSSTLRISRKGKKHSPRIVKREGIQDNEIGNFLEKRKNIKKIQKRMEKQHYKHKHKPDKHAGK